MPYRRTGLSHPVAPSTLYSDSDDGNESDTSDLPPILSSSHAARPISHTPVLDPVVERPTPNTTPPEGSSPSTEAGASGLTRMFAREKSRSPAVSPERRAPSAAAPVPGSVAGSSNGSGNGHGDAGAPGKTDGRRVRVVVRHPTGDVNDDTDDAGSSTTSPEDGAATGTGTGEGTPTPTGKGTTTAPNGAGGGDDERAPLLEATNRLQAQYGSTRADTSPSPSSPPATSAPHHAIPILTHIASASSPPSKSFFSRTANRLTSALEPLQKRKTYNDVIKDAASSFPAVILGLLLNILDGVSYGFIMFPTGSIFAGMSA